MSKLDSVLGDALLNVTGLKSLDTDVSEDVTENPATEDDLEDIPENAPEPEEESDAPEPANGLEEIPDEPTPDEPESPAEPITAPEPAIESKLDQRTKDYVLDLLHTEKDLRRAAREVVDKFRDEDEPRFVWVYQATKGPNSGKTYIGEEEAAASVSEEALKYVEFKEIFVKNLYRKNPDGSLGAKATKEELDAYLASENANPQPAADDQSGTNTAG